MKHTMSAEIAYPVDLEQDEDGVWIATFPDVPAAITQGATRAEALAAAEDALAAAIGHLMRRGKPPSFPQPHARADAHVPLEPLLAAKLALVWAQQEAGLSNVELGRRLGVAETEVRRMLDPGHATKLRRLDDALRLFGRRLTLGLSAV